MKIKIKAQREVDAKTLQIHCKVRDDFTASLVDAGGNVIHDQEDGYVPGFMPGEHYGDYVILDVDIETGQITNWKVPTENQLRKWIGGSDDE